jgi:O-acetyl-ADP-ribose deacetylase (regulator of RNase III)
MGKEGGGVRAGGNVITWFIKQADALFESADILVCPANVYLNLSGGVGGEILLRHGDAMQRQLHAHLAQTGQRHVNQGDMIVTGGCGLAFKIVLHAVAVDGFYQTSPAVVQTLVRAALQRAAALDARSVVLTALATGFGRLPMGDFAQALVPLTREDFSPVETVTLCLHRSDDVATVRAVLTN